MSRRDCSPFRLAFALLLVVQAILPSRAVSPPPPAALADSDMELLSTAAPTLAAPGADPNLNLNLNRAPRPAAGLVYLPAAEAGWVYRPAAGRLLGQADLLGPGQTWRSQLALRAATAPGGRAAKETCAPVRSSQMA